jgi:hypothetical protein
MTGVVIDGVQWERCNHCGDWENIKLLRYEQPTTGFPHGRDLCVLCAMCMKALGREVSA